MARPIDIAGRKAKHEAAIQARDKINRTYTNGYLNRMCRAARRIARTYIEWRYPQIDARAWLEQCGARAGVTALNYTEVTSNIDRLVALNG